MRTFGHTVCPIKGYPFKSSANTKRSPFLGHTVFNYYLTVGM